MEINTEDAMSDDLFWPDSDGEYTTEPLDRPYETAPPPAPARSRPWRTVAVAAGLSALVFGGAGVGVGAALEANDNDSASPIGSTGLDATPTSNDAGSVDPKSYAGIAAKVLPSVVSVNVTGSGQQDTGSGVIIRSDGYILTNNHVVPAAVDGGRVAAVLND